MRRSLLHVFALLLLSAVGLAAQQEQTLEDRLLRPNRTQISELNGKPFVRQNSSFGSEFSGRKAFATQSFTPKRHEPRRFLGIPMPWFGNKKSYATREYAGADLEFAKRVARTFEVQNAMLGNKEFADGGRTAFADARQIPMRKAIVRGKDQERLDAQSRELSVQEVRELLNKR